MSKKKTVRKSKLRVSTRSVLFVAVIAFTGVLGTLHYVRANQTPVPLHLDVDPNFGVKNQVIDFFEANNAPEMIPIVRCESRFRHYAKDGSVLKNTRGSSATGVTQILASVHPDPKIIARYNKAFDMDLRVEDFDITTLEGNLGYALVLYQVNGTKDWECSKRFRF